MSCLIVLSCYFALSFCILARLHITLAVITQPRDLDCEFTPGVRCSWRNGTNGIEDNFDWAIDRFVIYDGFHSIPRAKDGNNDWFTFVRGTQLLRRDDTALLISDSIPCQEGNGVLSFYMWKTAVFPSLNICIRKPPGNGGRINCIQQINGMHRQEWTLEEVAIPADHQAFEIILRAAFQLHHDIIGIDEIKYEARLCRNQQDALLQPLFPGGTGGSSNPGVYSGFYQPYNPSGPQDIRIVQTNTPVSSIYIQNPSPSTNQLYGPSYRAETPSPNLVPIVIHTGTPFPNSQHRSPVIQHNVLHGSDSTQFFNAKQAPETTFNFHYNWVSWNSPVTRDVPNVPRQQEKSFYANPHPIVYHHPVTASIPLYDPKQAPDTVFNYHYNWVAWTAATTRPPVTQAQYAPQPYYYNRRLLHKRQTVDDRVHLELRSDQTIVLRSLETNQSIEMPLKDSPLSAADRLHALSIRQPINATFEISGGLVRIAPNQGNNQEVQYEQSFPFIITDNKTPTTQLPVPKLAGVQQDTRAVPSGNINYLWRTFPLILQLLLSAPSSATQGPPTDETVYEVATGQPLTEWTLFAGSEPANRQGESARQRPRIRLTPLGSQDGTGTDSNLTPLPLNEATTSRTRNPPTATPPTDHTRAPVIQPDQEGPCSKLNCNFDASGMCNYQEGSTVTPGIRTLPWVLSDRQTANSLTGIFSDVNGEGMYAYAGGGSGVQKTDRFVLESPQFSTQVATRLEFFYYQAGVEGKFKVCIKDEFNCPFTKLGKDIKISARQWQRGTIDLPQSSNQKIFFIADELQKNYVIGLDNTFLKVAGTESAASCT